MSVTVKSRNLIKSLIQSKQSDILIEASVSVERTLSYTLPLIESNPPSTKGLPQLLVIAPTKQAVDRVAHAFDKNRAKTAVTLSVIGGTDRQMNITQLRQGCDYLIGTPGRLAILHKEKSLDTSCVSAVVLEEASVLLTSEAVLNFVNSSIPMSCQRILAASSISQWHEDTLKDLIRPGHTLERVKFSNAVNKELNKVSHEFFKTNSTEELRTMKHILDSRTGKTIVFCKGTGDVFAVTSDPMMGSDLLPLTQDMSENIKSQQVSKFLSSAKGVLVTTDPASILLPDKSLVGDILNLGSPSDADQYIHRGRFIQESGRMVTLVRSRDWEYFSKVRSKTGLTFTPIKLESIDHSVFSISFAKELIKNSDMTKIPTWLLKEGSDLAKLHDVNTLSSLVQLAESRRYLFEKRSPLSGMPGFIPILLFDPFMKKVRNYEMADKLVRNCFSEKKIVLGRIALSAKGYVVDVPSDRVGEVVENRRLSTKGIKALCISELPPLVQSDRLFALKQSKRDKKQALRLVKRRMGSGPKRS
jgi:ATP-dependent RNA helicase DeaD